ncbi:MAG TPA: peptidoglycan-binding domain-containing protein [Pyrinomonadaceae bacterium]|jgi:N-acetylmuramoyl-L-alanine amidase
MPLTFEIKDGDSVIKLSVKYGLFCETIWNHPDNAELRRKRKDMNTLLPGDILFIPDIRPKDVPADTGKLHRYRRKGVPANFSIQIYQNEQPYAHQDYKLVVDGVPYTGMSDTMGIVSKWIPPTAVEGVLHIGPDNYKILLRFGYLDPINEIIGVQKRLYNIGFHPGELDNLMGLKTRQALLDFQKRFDLSETGEADEETRSRLEEIHDEVNLFPKQSSETGSNSL